jgi:hypothetical protein
MLFFIRKVSNSLILHESRRSCMLEPDDHTENIGKENKRMKTFVYCSSCYFFAIFHILLNSLNGGKNMDDNSLRVSRKNISGKMLNYHIWIPVANYFVIFTA